MYKQFRSTSLNGAVAQLYSEMGGRHKAQTESLVIVRTTKLSSEEVKNIKNPSTQQLSRDGIKFPVLQRILRPSRKTFKSVFKADRPNLFV